MFNKLNSRRGGFTLVETMVAVFVLSIGVLGLAAMLADGIAYMNMSQYDFIAQHQIPADAWYVAYPDETVTSIRNAVKLRNALNVLFDAASADPKLRDALSILIDAAAAGH